MFLRKFLVVLLALLVCGAVGRSIPKESKMEQEIGETYGNPLLAIDATRNTLLDGTKTMNLTCSIVKEYKEMIKKVAYIGWRRKAPEEDESDLLTKLENGKFTWGDKVEKSWGKFKDLKKHGRVYGQDEAASAFVTIHVPRLPCENNGVFECFLSGTTKSGKQKKWSSFYDYNDESLCPFNFLLDIDPALMYLGIAAVALAFVFFVMLIIRRHFKRTMRKADRSLEKEEVPADRHGTSDLYQGSSYPMEGSAMMMHESGNLRGKRKARSEPQDVPEDGEVPKQKRRVKKWRRKKRVRRHERVREPKAQPKARPQRIPRMTHGPMFIEDSSASA